MSDVARLFAEVAKITGHLFTELAADMGIPDWTYRDVGRATPAAWQELFEIAGSDNIRLLAMTQGNNEHGPFVRGQMFISPEGMKRLQEFATLSAGAKEQRGEGEKT